MQSLLCGVDTENATKIITQKIVPIDLKRPMTDVVHNRRHLLREVQLVMLNDDDKETHELRFKITTKLLESEILRLLEHIKIEMPFNGHDHRGTYPAREVPPI